MSAPFDPTADYYATLGVDANASADEIKKAYRRLAKQYHPDSTGGDKRKEAKFKEISSAYDVLGDSDKRREYDAFRAGPRMGPGFGPGFDAGAGGFGGAVELFWGATTTGVQDVSFVRTVFHNNYSPYGTVNIGGSKLAQAGTANENSKVAFHNRERSIKSKPLGPTVQATKNIDSNAVFRYKI